MNNCTMRTYYCVLYILASGGCSVGIGEYNYKPNVGPSSTTAQHQINIGLTSLLGYDCFQ